MFLDRGDDTELCLKHETVFSRQRKTQTLLGKEGGMERERCVGTEMHQFVKQQYMMEMIKLGSISGKTLASYGKSQQSLQL